jgi:hypothetical protein
MDYGEWVAGKWYCAKDVDLLELSQHGSLPELKGRIASRGAASKRRDHDVEAVIAEAASP